MLLSLIDCTTCNGELKDKVYNEHGEKVTLEEAFKDSYYAVAYCSKKCHYIDN